MPTNRFIVGPGQEFNYPADPTSLQILKNAGGRAKLSEEERAIVKFKTVKEGWDCSDMPKETLELYVSRGWVIDKEAPVVGSELESEIEPEPEPEPDEDKPELDEDEVDN